MNEHSTPTVDSTVNRRQTLSLLAGLTGFAAFAAACGSSAKQSATTQAATSATDAAAVTTPATAATQATPAATAAPAATSGAVDATPTPTETGGPFPADGTNDNGAGQVANVLADQRSVRSDITADLDGLNAQSGVPLSLKVNVVDSSTGAALPGVAVYIWHCSKDGVYSEYNSPMLGGDYSARSYLRGVQITDGSGAVEFASILPGRYQGRAFHIHFEVYSDATYGTKLLTSQMAIDDDLIDTLYAAADGYASALRNDTSNNADNIFSDGVKHQLLAVTGDVATGLAATFTAVV